MTYSHRLPESIRNNAALIDEKLADITVCDPAVGSGAFPVGMMSDIVRARNVLSTFVKDKNRTPYEFKRRCIEHSLYGVDIDPGAVEIAKLRLWLSLIVDEDDINNIKPLPNLDYKIMQGNSLIELLSPDLISSANPPKRDKLVRELKNAKEELFNITNPSRKNKMRAHIDKLMNDLFEYDRIRIISKLKDDIVAINSQTRLFKDEKYRKEDKKKILEIESKIEELKNVKIPGPTKHFEWHINYSEIFKDKGGFDVVIANPPYGAKFSESDKKYLKKHYEHIVERIRNSFLYFLGLAYALSKECGIVSYIIPNEFLFQIYMTKARTYFLNHSQFIYAFNIGEDVFEAIVPTCLIAIKKDHIDNYHIPVADLRNISLNELDNKLQAKVFDNTNKDMVLKTVNSIFSFNTRSTSLVNKIIEAYQPFDDFCDTVSNGVCTSCDDVYIVNKKFSQKRHFESQYLKPCIRGGQLNRYFCPSDTGDQLLYITKEFNAKNGSNILNYLKEHRQLLVKKSVEKKNGNRPWHILFRARDESLFQIPKLLFRQTGDSIIACLDEEVNYYGINSVNITILKDSFIDQRRFFLGILNSTLIDFIYKEISQEGGRVLSEVKPQRIRALPIAMPVIEKRKPIEDIVDRILELTNDEKYLHNSQKQDRVQSLEREIDQLVYKLYDLTPEEIKIVEGE